MSRQFYLSLIFLIVKVRVNIFYVTLRKDGWMDGWIENYIKVFSSVVVGSRLVRQLQKQRWRTHNKTGYGRCPSSGGEQSVLNTTDEFKLNQSHLQAMS